jgi:uncharacterized membrane protein YdjX (TVP38/TMEM64 family)
MGYYSLLLLFLGVLFIGIVYARTDAKNLKTNLIFLLILLLFLIVFFTVHHHFAKTCEILIEGSVSQVLGIIESWGIASPIISIFLMTMQAVIAPLPAFLITAANGLLFGLFWGTLISLIGAMGGALVSFLISRWFYNTYVKKVLKDKKAAEYVEKISGRHGFKIILITRLLPFVSFDLISYAAGLSSIKFRPFVLATLIGMTPATIVYTMLGHKIAEMEKYSTALFVYSTGAALVLIIIWIVQGLTSKRSKKEE